MPLIVAVLIAGSLGFHALRGDARAQNECPPLRPGTNDAAADYADIFIWNGATYRVDQHAPDDVRIGGQTTTVGCSIAELTRTNHQLVGPLPWPNRTATFLPAGTPVFDIPGARRACELAAVTGKKVTVYTSGRAGC